jgi:hypothetical protein
LTVSSQPSCERWTGAKAHSSWWDNKVSNLSAVVHPRLAYLHLGEGNCSSRFATVLEIGRSVSGVSSSWQTGHVCDRVKCLVIQRLQK